MVLLLTEQGISVSIQQGNIVIEGNNLKRKFPKELLETVIIFGNVNLTTPFVNFCLTKNVNISFFSIKGKYFGRLTSTINTNIFRLKKQLFLTDEKEYKTELSKKIIFAKITNQIETLRRYDVSVEKPLIKNINEMVFNRRKIEEISSIDELLGIEGYCARVYFNGLSKILPEEYKFKGRNKRPPRDPFNSMLSLGYTLAMNEIMGQLEAVYLNPYGGFLHKDRERHPTLASDLVEEWRALLIYSLCLDLVLNDKIKLDDFVTYEDVYGVFLTQKGMKIFLAALADRWDQRNNYLDYLKYPVTFRKAIYHQCSSLARSIEYSDTDIYQPILIRW